MKVYGKIFESIYDGTLYGQWEALVTFQQMIVLSDCDGTLDMTPQALSARTGIPFDIIKKGIEVLEQDDPYSRTQNNSGRRIERMDEHRPWGWTIINHQYYRNLASAEDKRKNDRERIAKKRKENKGVASCSDVSQVVADVAHTDTDTDTDTKKKINKRKTTCPDIFPITSQMKKYADSKNHYPDLELLTEKFILHAKTTGRKCVSWYAAWQRWVLKDIEMYGLADTRPMEERFAE